MAGAIAVRLYEDRANQRKNVSGFACFRARLGSADVIKDKSGSGLGRASASSISALLGWRRPFRHKPGNPWPCPADVTQAYAEVNGARAKEVAKLIGPLAPLAQPWGPSVVAPCDPRVVAWGSDSVLVQTGPRLGLGFAPRKDVGLNSSQERVIPPLVVLAEKADPSLRLVKGLSQGILVSRVLRLSHW